MAFKVFVHLFLIGTCASCLSPQKKIEIIPLTMLNKYNALKATQGSGNYKAEYFLVKNYKDDNTSQAYIDSFVANNKAADFENYNQYNMIFYKESKITNVSHLKDNPRDLDRYSQNNDWIYEYEWLQGKFLSRRKIKNGEVVEPKNNIIITDVPKDSL